MAVQSKERLNELLEKYRLTGDMNVRNEIVLMYMDLVKMIGYQCVISTPDMRKATIL